MLAQKGFELLIDRKLMILISLLDILGIKPTDLDLMYHLLENYKKDVGLLELASKLIEKTKEVILIAEDVEKLKEENEELRKEVERLREQLKNQTTVNNAREAFTLFVRMVTKEAEGQLSQETFDYLLQTLTEFGQIFRDGKLNWEKIRELGMRGVFR